MFSKLAMILKSTAICRHYSQCVISLVVLHPSYKFSDRVTVAFFLFSMVHCFAQGIIQSFLYSIDTEFEGVVTEIVHAAHIPLINMTYLEGSSNHLTLRMCDNIPHGQSHYPCMVIFQSGVNVINASAVESDTQKSISILADYSQGFEISTADDGVLVKSSAAEPVILNQQCAQILVYPQQVLQNSVREDMTFIFFQFWVLGVSVFAVGRGSIPHMITALGSRFLIAAWSAYIVIYRTKSQQRIFRELVSAPGTPCGVELFPTYFGTRYVYNIADVVMSFTALLLSALLSWNLLKVYSAQSFKRVGAPEHVLRIYKYFMAVQAVLQLEVFVLVVATSLWVDVLTRTAISKISTHTPIYDALIIATTVLVIPWIALGWYGVRREQKRLIISFLGVGFFFISGWAIMFYSIVYRWSFVQWPYLGCFTVASFILIISSMILGTICWRNFDQGLAQYLNAEDALADSNFAPEVFQHSDVEKSGEKSDYYTYDEPDFPMPTFHSAMQSGEIMRSDGSRMPAPVRGPPPSYDRPYNAPTPF
ncbi:hypothetical protein MVEN_02581100 [Mycena venus]|uniref:Uncharacterized protein n=1 Tax=Mycena venus TaxID=2733690 RepID=A0A8H6U1N5_9AGAR|nr:hypothetical protein MVEN_02581100 [Mycena venus]